MLTILILCEGLSNAPNMLNGILDEWKLASKIHKSSTQTPNGACGVVKSSRNPFLFFIKMTLITLLVWIYLRLYRSDLLVVALDPLPWRV